MSGKWYKLRFAVNFIDEPDAIERLDVSILQNYLLAPILGIDDPRTNDRIGFVGGARGTEELEKLVDEGKGASRFFAVPDDDGRTFRRLRYERNYAAEINLVRAETARWTFDSLDLNSKFQVQCSKSENVERI